MVFSLPSPFGEGLRVRFFSLFTFHSFQLERLRHLHVFPARNGFHVVVVHQRHAHTVVSQNNSHVLSVAATVGNRTNQSRLLVHLLDFQDDPRAIDFSLQIAIAAIHFEPGHGDGVSIEVQLAAQIQLITCEKALEGTLGRHG